MAYDAAVTERIAQHYDRYARQYRDAGIGAGAVMFTRFAEKVRAGRDNDFTRRVRRIAELRNPS